MSKQEDIEYKAIDLKILKRLLVYLKPYKKWVAVSVVITIISSALAPVLPYLTKIAVDKYIEPRNWNGLVGIIFIIGVLLLVNAFLRFVLTYLMQWLGQKVLFDVRMSVFKHIQSLSMRFYDTNPVGRLVTRVTNDVEGLNELFSQGVVMIAADIMLIFWIIGFMFYTNWELSLLTLSVIPLLLFSTVIFRKRVRVLFHDIRLRVAEMNTFLNEFISGINTVKVFIQEENQNKKFDSINSQHKELWVRTVFYYAIFFPTVEMLSAIALGIVLWYSAGNILSGVMTVGILIAFTQYAEMFFRPIRDLTEKFTTLQSAMASAERILSILDTKDIADDKPDAKDMPGFHKAIEFKNVSFSYDSAKWVLKDVSFTVNKSETVAIVGATGAGKTSIINLLCRFYDYNEGEILIDGTDIRSLNQNSLREHFALVMQDVYLFSRTLAENISLGKEQVSDKDIRKAAISLGADYFIERLSSGYETEMIDRGSALSAGQRQLIAFCRAYAMNPEILILDEATSNIDSETERIISTELEKLLENRTSIIIAHRLSTIRRADKIIVLHKGTIREIGTHKELLALNGIYARLYQLQFKEQIAV
ncbi:MAG: ABC transporter ATP-binding protein/permease [Bacteroidetes bacterium]|nr:ABC transporter ATP-binding protein/permease [Bacteroidota bacterium]